MTVPTILVALVVVLGVAALVVAAVLARTMTRRRDDDGLVASLRAELEAQRREVEATREASVHQAIQSVVHLASEALDQHLQAGTRHLDHRNELVGERLDVMESSLHRLGGLVTELDRQRAEGYGELTSRLEQAGRATAALAQTTEALRAALSNPTARGQWGERMAEDVLRTAGFVDGINYVRQTAARNGRPDFTFLLPAGRKVHMDVKFPLDNYVRWMEADGDAERTAALRAFQRDVRNRVKELAARDYVDPGDGTLDQVLLFLPNEQLYAFIHQHDPELLDIALRQKVVPCSPLTLFAVLAVIRQAVDDHLLERRSGEILEVLADFQQQWDKFTDRLDALGSRLETTRRAYDEVNGPRRRQLERQLDRVEELRQDRRDDVPAGALLPLPGRGARDDDEPEAAVG